MHARREELARVRASAADRETRRELLTFQLGEMDRAHLKDVSAGETTRPRIDRDATGTGERRARRAVCARRATRRSTSATMRFSRSLGGRLAPRLRTGGARSAVPAVPRRAGRDQVAARGPRRLPARATPRHRGLARAPAADRGTAGAPRAAQARSTDRRWPTSSRVATRCGGNWTISTGAGRTHGGAGARPRRTARAAFLEAADRLSTGGGVSQGFAPQLESLVGGARDGWHALRVRFDDGPLPESAWSARGIDAAGVLRLAEPRARISGRSRGLSPAASCRASCSRSRR